MGDVHFASFFGKCSWFMVAYWVLKKFNRTQNPGGNLRALFFLVGNKFAWFGNYDMCNMSLLFLHIR